MVTVTKAKDTGCFVGWDLFQRMIRTFGIGSPDKSALFGRLDSDLMSENVGKSQEKCKKQRVGKMSVLWAIIWSMVDHIVPKPESVF